MLPTGVNHFMARCVPSLIPRSYYEATTHVADLFADEADAAASQVDTDQPPGIVPLPIDPESVPTEADAPWRLLEERRLDLNRPSHRGYRRTTDFVVYRADPATCNAGPVKEHCTTSDRGRTIQRSIFEDYLEKVRSYHATEPYQKAIRTRVSR